MKILLAGISSLFTHRRLISAINEAPQRTISAINVVAGDTEIVTLKYGVYPHDVGLQVFDKAAATEMVKTFNNLPDRAVDLFRGLPIYVGHPDDPGWKKQNPTVREEAVGRIKKLEAGDDGMRITRAFNDEGKRLLSGEAAAYDRYSPNWGMVPTTHMGRKAFRPVELYSIGLTNRNNIPGTFIGLNEKLPTDENSAMKSKLIALLAALGRPIANAAEVTDDQLATAINEATPVATLLVTASNELTTTKAKLTTAEASLTTASNQVTSLTTQLTTANGLVKAANEARVDLVLTSAVNEGRITQAQRTEWAGKFSAQGADFTTVEGELKKLKKAVNTRSAVGGLGARKEEQVASGNKIRAINEAIATKKSTNANLSHADAYAAVKLEKPELFASEAAE